MSVSGFQVFDASKCALGEGALWHPKLETLFWIDIISKTLHAKMDGKLKSWHFDENISAAAWIDDDNLMISSATGLSTFCLSTGARKPVAQIEADNPVTRSNDGRADRQNGFWVSTMGFQAEAGAGAIYRYYKGEVRKLYSEITIPNSICFSPDGSVAYFTDTPTKKIMRQGLDQATGWLSGEADVYLDLSHRNDGPDGAVIDAAGNIWIAFWGEGRVEGFDQVGKSVGGIQLPALHTTCPAFGGEDLQTMFVTTATEGLSQPVVHEGTQGATFEFSLGFKGVAEPNVIV